MQAQAQEYIPSSNVAQPPDWARKKANFAVVDISLPLIFFISPKQLVLRKHDSKCNAPTRLTCPLSQPITSHLTLRSSTSPVSLFLILRNSLYNSITESLIWLCSPESSQHNTQWEPRGLKAVSKLPHLLRFIAVSQEGKKTQTANNVSEAFLSHCSTLSFKNTKIYYKILGPLSHSISEICLPSSLNVYSRAFYTLWNIV